MVTPNYKPGVGRLTTDRYDFQNHVDGYSFNHAAGGIVISPPVVVDGYGYSNLQSILEKLATVAYPPVIQDATSAVKGILKLAGDLSGTATSPRVTGIQSFPISYEAPQDGYILTFDAVTGSWRPLPPITVPAPSSDLSFGMVKLAGTYNAGDVGGTAASLKIVGIQGIPLQISNPMPQQFLSFDGVSLSNVHLPQSSLYQPGILQLAGDLTGNSISPSIGALQGFPLQISCPNDNDVIQYKQAINKFINAPAPFATETISGAVTLKEDTAPGAVGGIKVVGLRLVPIKDQTPYSGQYLKYTQDSTTSSAAGYWAPAYLPESVVLTNDLGGTYLSPSVVGLWDRPFDPSVQSPGDGQILVYNDGYWYAQDPGGYFTAGRDLAGGSTSQTVMGLWNKSFASRVQNPLPGDILFFNSAGQWDITRIPSGGGATGPTGPAGSSAAPTATGPTGPTGTDGTNGLGYDGLTSPTTIAFNPASMPYTRTFYTNLTTSQTAFAIGARVRASLQTSPTSYVEGIIYNFVGNQLDLLIDSSSISTTGSYGSSTNIWYINVAGKVGPAGSVGPAGPAGTAGPAGSTGPTGTTGSSGIGSVIVFGVDVLSNPVSPYNYLIPGGPSATISTIREIVMPIGGTLKNLYVKHNTPGSGGGATFTYTVRKNNVNTSLSASLSNTGSVASDTSSSHYVSIAAGDSISVIVTASITAPISSYPQNVVVSMLLA